MIQQFITAIEPLGYPIRRQGSMGPDEEYPESFFTFWNFQADEVKTFDNKPVGCNWGYWLYFYSTDPVLVENELLKAKDLLKQAGFDIWGKGEDVKSDVETHTGRMITVYFDERY